MILSHCGPLAAAASLFLFWGAAAEVDDRHLKERQAAATSSTPSPQATGLAPIFFQTIWPGVENSIVPFNTTLSVPYTISEDINLSIQQQADVQQLPLILMWTSASRTDNPSSENTWGVLDIGYTCFNSTSTGACQWKAGNKGAASINVSLNPKAQAQWMQNLGRFFLTFVTTDPSVSNTHYCESYSPFFDIAPPDSRSNSKLRRADEQVPVSLPPFTSVLSVTQTTQILTSSGSPAATPAPPASQVFTVIDGHTYHASFVFATGAPTTTMTLPPSQSGTATPGSASSSKSSSGLPIGAIVGIAIGGFVIVLLALLVCFFFYCRNRRHGAQRTPEQALLTHNMLSGSRELVGEKLEAEGPMLGISREIRLSSGPYDHHSSSAPYNGPLGPGRISLLPSTQHALLPQRHPTSATVNTVTTVHTEVSNLSRGISDASVPTRSTQPGGDFEQVYHDVPIYRDARHLPQGYQGNLQAPFLSEPGMTDEELTRLEEEERRIDAAILEAEGRRLKH